VDDDEAANMSSDGSLENDSTSPPSSSSSASNDDSSIPLAVKSRAREGLALGLARKEKERRMAELEGRRWVGWESTSSEEGGGDLKGEEERRGVGSARWIALPLVLAGLGSCIFFGE